MDATIDGCPRCVFRRLYVRCLDNSLTQHTSHRADHHFPSSASANLLDSPSLITIYQPVPYSESNAPQHYKFRAVRSAGHSSNWSSYGSPGSCAGCLHHAPLLSPTRTRLNIPRPHPGLPKRPASLDRSGVIQPSKCHVPGYCRPRPSGVTRRPLLGHCSDRPEWTMELRQWRLMIHLPHPKAPRHQRATPHTGASLPRHRRPALADNTHPLRQMPQPSPPWALLVPANHPQSVPCNVPPYANRFDQPLPAVRIVNHWQPTVPTSPPAAEQEAGRPVKHTPRGSLESTGQNS